MVMLRRKLLRDLMHMRGQAIAIALIVASAIATYVTMRGAYESLLVTQQTYYDDYRFAQVFGSLKRAPESVAERLRAIPGVAAVDTSVRFIVTLDVPGLREPASAMLISVPDRGEARLNRVHIRRGRAVATAGEVLVSEEFASANTLEPGASLSAVINGRWRRLRVAGVAITPEFIEESRGDSLPDHRRFGIMWMRRDELAGATGMRGAFNSVALTLAPGASEGDVIAAIDRVLAPWGGLGAFGREEQSSYRFLRDELAQDRITSIVMPAIFLAVAILLIHLLLVRLVISQREQIAVLKAFGYGNAAIARHFAGFAIVIVLAGSMGGVPLGLWMGRGLTKLYTRFFHFPMLRFEVSAFAIALSIATTLAAALAGSFIAVRRVAALAPAEGMRPEAPARFGGGWLDRVGIVRAVSPPVRMIVRSLQRTPMRTTTSLLALATAGMILVVGQFSFDAVESMIDVHFRAAQSEDITLQFTEVRSDASVPALRRLPGVTLVEPMRVVPVRVRAAHHARKVPLTGMERNATLRRLMAMDGHVVELPAGGVVMTTKLAEILEVKPGDRVQLEALVAPRPVTWVRVAALVDESLGMSIYARRDLVNRFMREGPALSSALLAVEPSQSARLYQYLKTAPAVGSVALREVMLASFKQTLAENLYISGGTIVFFACVIAFGVIYNGARIALSERGRDLASLRVLGFSQGEVGAMLIGEQVLLTLVSIPIGFGAGYALGLWIATLFSSELYRIPFVVSARTYSLSFLVIAFAATSTAFVVQRRVAALDLVGVLKTRE